MTSGIYSITNTVNGKQYVGSAVNIRTRWNSHRSDLNSGKREHRHLLAAWRTYGADAFTFTVLEECPVADLLTREQYWIDTLDTVATGYNTRLIARSNLGLKFTPEQCAHIAAGVRTARTPELQARISQSLRAVFATPEQQERRAQTTQATWANPETRARRLQGMQAALADATWQTQHAEFMRQQWTDPAIREQRLRGLRAYLADPANREQIGKRNRDHYNNHPEARDHLAEQTRRHWDDPAYKARVSQSIREALADPVLKERQAERMRGVWADPERRAYITQQIQDRYDNDPELRAQTAIRMQPFLADPTWLANRNQHIREAHARPEVRARRQALLADSAFLARRGQRIREGHARKKAERPADTERQCRKCQEVRDIAGFRPSSHVCKVCDSRRVNAWKAARRRAAKPPADFTPPSEGDIF